MTELERCPLVLVKPNLHVSCHCVCCKMYVEMCCSVSARASDDAFHDAFEGRQPTVQGIVKCWCGESCEIGAKNDVETGTFCNAIVSNEPCPNVLLVPCLPVNGWQLPGMLWWHISWYSLLWRPGDCLGLPNWSCVSWYLHASKAAWVFSGQCVTCGVGPTNIRVLPVGLSGS